MYGGRRWGPCERAFATNLVWQVVNSVRLVGTGRRKKVPLRKDEILDRLAKRGNVAQFVAFRPNGVAGAPQQSFSRISGASVS